MYVSSQINVQWFSGLSMIISFLSLSGADLDELLDGGLDFVHELGQHVELERVAIPKIY